MANRSKFISSKTGSRIRELRIAAGYTQKELSERLYKSESAIRMWELGKSEPDLQAINSLSEIFSVSSDYLLGVSSIKIESKEANKEALKFALFGGDTEVTEEMLNKVLEYANLLKLNHQMNTKEDNNEKNN